MPKFRKKPVEVQAVQYNQPGDHPAIEFGMSVTGKPNAMVRGRQGWVNVDPGDWIIAEADGSGHYPCKPDVFAASYDPA